MAAKRKHNNQMKSFYGFDEQHSEASKRSKRRDAYCWLCHRHNTNVSCTTCIRTYHRECIGKWPQSTPYQCETCKRLNLANSCMAAKFTNVEYLNQLLVLTTKRLFDDQEFSGFNQNYYENHGTNIEDCGIVNPIHLDSINGKVQNSEYRSTVDFINDIRWICHNITIMNGPENKSSLRIAKRLEKFCTKEIYDIEMCHQCYLRSNTQTNWFTAVCDPPHLLVWARVNSQSGYAPAKVLGLCGNTASKKVDVRFFADHEMAVVAASNCYLFSNRRPSDKPNEQTKFKRTTALQEVGIYVGNICKVFSNFVKAECQTQFNEREVVNHLTSMIPGLRLTRDFRLVTKPSYLNRLCRRHAPIASLPNDDNDNSSSNEDKESSPQEKPTLEPALEPSALSPKVILEKCDLWLAKQQQSSNMEYTKNGETFGVIGTVNHEPKIDGGSEGEADMVLEEDTTITNNCWMPSTNSEETPSHSQSSATLLTVAVVSKQNRVNAASGTGSVHNFGTVGNVDTTSTPMQPFVSQRNESQRIDSFGSTSHPLNANQHTNAPEINEMNSNDDDEIMPLSMPPKPSEFIAINCDWEEMLDKYQTRVRKRQRINRKIILNRERAHLMRVNQLKSTVNVLQKKNHKLHLSMQKMEGQHTSMIQNAIEETKRKKWCWNCQIELKHVAPNIPMCKDCINRNWFGAMTGPTTTPEYASPGFQNPVLVEPPSIKEYQPHRRNAVDQILADFNLDDPLSLELEGF